MMLVTLWFLLILLGVMVAWLRTLQRELRRVEHNVHVMKQVQDNRLDGQWSVLQATLKRLGELADGKQ